MPDEKLTAWRSRADEQAARAAEAQARQVRIEDIAKFRADPQTLEEVLVRLKAIEARLPPAPR